MTKTARWIIPEATEPGGAGQARGRTESAANAGKRVRIALFDNSKANAEHLLAILHERIQHAFPDADVLDRRKSNAAIGAPAALLDQVANEADWAITAMAD